LDAPVPRRGTLLEENAPDGPAERSSTVFDLIRQGGPVMAPILLISLASIALIVERALAFSRAREKRRDLVAWTLEKIERGAVGEVSAELAALISVEARVLMEGVKARNVPAPEREARMQACAMRELAALERNVPWLSSVASIETLLGLLGTVTGMIRSFLSLRVSGIADPSILAGGIAEALITTAAGLVVAIPSLVAFHVFRQILDRTASRIEMASADLHAALARRRGIA